MAQRRTKRTSSTASSRPTAPNKSEAFDTLPHFRKFGGQMLWLPDNRGRLNLDPWQDHSLGSYFGDDPPPDDLAGAEAGDLLSMLRLGELDPRAIAQLLGATTTPAPFITAAAAVVEVLQREGALEPSDLAILRGASRLTLVLVPTGNGKTALYAAVALHHATFVRPDARVVILSSTGKQARKLLLHVRGFIARSPYLRERWVAREHYGAGRIDSLFDDSVIEIVTPSPLVAEGEDPWLYIGDEIHEHPDDGESFELVAQKWKKRRARGLAASTAGDDEASYLGRKRALALDPEHGGEPEEGLRPGEFYLRGKQYDPLGALTAVVHEWAVPDGVSTDDLDEVKKANPAAYITVEDLAVDYALTRARPGDWDRRNCNRWTREGTAAIDATAWRDNGEPPVRVEDMAGLPFFVALDVGGVSDSTAAIPVWRGPDVDGVNEDGEPEPQPQLYTAGGQIVWPPGGGELTRIEDVLTALDLVCAYPGELKGIVFDPNSGGRYMIADVRKRRPDLLFIEHGQQGEMRDAGGWLAQAVYWHWLRHDADPEIATQVLAAVWEKAGGGVKLGKPRRPGRKSHLQDQGGPKIDAATALAMGVKTSLFPPDLSAAPIALTMTTLKGR